LYNILIQAVRTSSTLLRIEQDRNILAVYRVTAVKVV